MNRVCLLASLSAVLIAAPLVAATPDAAPAARPSADALVRQALEAEVDGDAARRDQLLGAAVAAEPQHAPAHWLRGEMKVDGLWEPVAEVERHAAADGRYAEYLELGASLADDPDRERQLAAWCDRHALRTEARYHWRNVLEADAGDADALRALNLVAYKGGVATPDEIAAEQARRDKFKRNFEQFAQRFRKMIREAGRGTLDERQETLAAIRAMREPDAIPALIQVISYEAPQDKKGPLSKLSKEARWTYVLQLHEALLGALGDMPHPEATIDLVNYSVYAPAPEVRKYATKALRLRPETEYVPRLMDELASPVEMSVDVTYTLDGGSTVATECYQEGRWSNVKQMDVLAVQGGGRAIRPRREGIRPWISPAAVRRVSAAAANAVASAESTNAQIEARNARIAEVLAQVTGQNPSWGARQWWDAWAQYNELVVINKPEDQATVINNFYLESMMMSCFPMGTTVWTRAGRTSIENVTVGDFVLSQDPDTGELAYRPVVKTTLRPPSRLVELDLPGETLQATRGHRFWVAGRGWEMAKFLKVGTTLHGLQGGVDVADVRQLDKDQQAEAYNLVVDGFHTYFVGENRVLVYDNSCPGPVRAGLPGMTPAAEWWKLADPRDWVAMADVPAAQIAQ